MSEPRPCLSTHDGYICTLDRGHDTPHKAFDSDGVLCHLWQVSVRFLCADCEREFPDQTTLVRHIIQVRKEGEPSCALERTPIHDELAAEFAVREASQVVGNARRRYVPLYGPVD